MTKPCVTADGDVCEIHPKYYKSAVAGAKHQCHTALSLQLFTNLEILYEYKLQCYSASFV